VIPDGLDEPDVHEDESGQRSDAEEQQVEAVDVQVVVEGVSERFAVDHDVDSTHLLAARVDPAHDAAVKIPAPQRTDVQQRLSSC